jgi:hypothetical protein
MAFGSKLGCITGEVVRIARFRIYRVDPHGKFLANVRADL